MMAMNLVDNANGHSQCTASHPLADRAAQPETGTEAQEQIGEKDAFKIRQASSGQTTIASSNDGVVEQQDQSANGAVAVNYKVCLSQAPAMLTFVC